jgi:hypothetical protein
MNPFERETRDAIHSTIDPNGFRESCAANAARSRNLNWSGLRPGPATSQILITCTWSAIFEHAGIGSSGTTNCARVSKLVARLWSLDDPTLMALNGRAVKVPAAWPKPAHERSSIQPGASALSHNSSGPRL